MKRRASWQTVLLATAVVGLQITACASQGAKLGKKATGSVRGSVVDGADRPIAGASIAVPGGRPVTADGNGEFLLRSLEANERQPLNVSAAGYRNTTVLVEVVAEAETPVQVLLLPRAEPVRFEAASGGTIDLGGGGALTIPPGALVDARGRPASGEAAAQATLIDVSSPEGLRSAPGDFTARLENGSTATIESFGMVELVVTDGAGAPLDLRPGAEAGLSIPIPERSREGAPPEIGLYRFDPSSGLWVERGVMTLDEGRLTYSGSVTSVRGEWNGDVPIDTTCVTIQVVDPSTSPPNRPVGGATVEARGVKYNAVSRGSTNTDGQVCLLVKRNEPVRLQAFGPPGSGLVSPITTVTSPDLQSGRTDCGDCFACPPVATLEVGRCTWTGWLDRDNPGGDGDFETLVQFVQSGQVCPSPRLIECRTRDGHRPASTTGQLYTCDPEIGGVCDDRRLPEGQTCLDYEVRFCC